MTVNSPVPPTIKFKPHSREVLPFDPQPAIARLSKLHSAYHVAGQNLRIAPTINRSEARFWLEVMIYSVTGSWPTTVELVEHLTKVLTIFDSPPSAADTLTQLDKLNARRCPPELVTHRRICCL